MLGAKITNEQLIQIAAVDAGLDPFGEYCTKGMFKAAGYRVKSGEKPALVVALWCPRQSKGSATDTAEPQQDAETPGLFFQLKTCHLFTREQAVKVEDLEAEKLSKKFKKQRAAELKAAIMPAGIAPDQDYIIPRWCKRKTGTPIDVAVERVQQAGFRVEDSNGLYQLLLAM